AEKATIYECGEPTVGSAWVQFDLRYYVVALLFVIFDVEVAFFFPWAVVFGQATAVAQVQPANPGAESEQLRLAREELLRGQTSPITGGQGAAAKQFALVGFVDIGVFSGVLLVGFAYLWRGGARAWVRSPAADRGGEVPPPRAPADEGERVLVGTAG